MQRYQKAVLPKPNCIFNFKKNVSGVLKLPCRFVDANRDYLSNNKIHFFLSNNKIHFPPTFGETAAISTSTAQQKIYLRVSWEEGGRKICFRFLQMEEILNIHLAKF